MTRARWVTIVEVVLGPLLATLCLLPFLLFGGVGVAFAILATLTDPFLPLSSSLAMALPQLTLTLSLRVGRGDPCGYRPSHQPNIQRFKIRGEFIACPTGM